MDPNKKLLCVIVPCFDEEQAVEHTHAELRRVLDDIPGYDSLLYFVDDGSGDTTPFKLQALQRKDPRVRLITLSRNFGHQAALTAGLELCDKRADAVLAMDADLENPPALIPKMLHTFERGYDVVMGVREAERAVGVGKRLTSRVFYWLFNKLSDVPIQPGAPDFFLLSPRAREALQRMPERSRFLRGMVTWIGFERAYVPYTPPARVGGRSKYTLAKMLSFASDAIFAFSDAPIRAAVGLGGVTLLLGLLLALVSMGLFLAAHPARGWVAMASLVTLLAGLQLSVVGIVGGYVARIFEHSKGRPLYIVKDAAEERGRGDERGVTRRHLDRN